MKHVALYGYPLHHSVSPAMHHAAAAALALDLSYSAIQVQSADLLAAVSSLRDERWLGANVTLPHKRAVLQMVDEVTPLAMRVGAGNTIFRRDTRLIVDNTDVAGLTRALREQLDFQPVEERALVLGAGGAARAAVAALQEAGVPSIGIWNRSAENASELRRSLATAEIGTPSEIFLVDSGALEPLLRDATLVINATSVGIDGLLSPLSSLPDRSDGRLFDLVYGLEGTPLVRMARESGWRAVDGLWMLVYQAATAFELWFSIQPPEELMYHAAQLALRQRYSTLAGDPVP